MILVVNISNSESDFFNAGFISIQDLLRVRVCSDQNPGLSRTESVLNSAEIRDHRTVFAPVRRVRRFQKMNCSHGLHCSPNVNCSHGSNCSHCSNSSPGSLFALFVILEKKLLTEQCEQANMFVRSSVVPAYL